VFAHYVRIVIVFAIGEINIPLLLLHGVHASLIPELITSDQQSYRNYFRMDYDSFTLLLDKVHPMLQRQDMVMRASITSSERLSVTLRFLTIGKEKHIQRLITITVSCMPKL